MGPEENALFGRFRRQSFDGFRVLGYNRDLSYKERKA